jgi:hypothetical protein
VSCNNVIPRPAQTAELVATTTRKWPMSQRTSSSVTGPALSPRFAR